MTVPATIAPLHVPYARFGAACATAVDTSSLASELSARERRLYAPGELVSLWDMLRIYAKDLSVLLTTLDRVAMHMDKTPEMASRRGVDFSNPMMRLEFWNGIWGSLNPLLDDVRRHLRPPGAEVRVAEDSSNALSTAMTWVSTVSYRPPSRKSASASTMN